MAMKSLLKFLWMMWCGKSEEKIRAAIKRLYDEHFPMTCEGQVYTYLGMKYVYGVDDEDYVTLEVNQTTYIEQLIERFKLTDLGPDKDYGFEQAQGGPPDNTAEDMMRELWIRAKGRRLADP